MRKLCLAGIVLAATFACRGVLAAPPTSGSAPAQATTAASLPDFGSAWAAQMAAHPITALDSVSITRSNLNPTIGTITPAGTTQATAAPVLNTINIISGGNSNNGISLGTATSYSTFSWNSNSFAINHYPAPGASLNAAATGTSLSLPAGMLDLCNGSGTSQFCGVMYPLGTQMPTAGASGAWTFPSTVTATTFSATGSGIPPTGIDRPAANVLGLTCNSVVCGEFTADGAFNVMNMTTAGIITNTAAGKFVSNPTLPFVNNPLFSRTTGITSGVISYGPLDGGGAAVGSASAISVPMNQAGTFANLHAYIQTALTGTQTVAVTLTVNGNAKALTCTLTSASQNCPPDTVDTVPVVADNLVTWQFTSTGAPTASIGVSAEFHNP